VDWEAVGFSLTEEQRAAAEAPPEGLCVVEAGAGCGKTHLVTARFVYLVLEKGIEPDAILCLTFSEHAAGEMRRRIKKALQSLGTFPRSICASTFHAFCESVLRESGEAVGLSGDFAVLDEGEVELLFEQSRRRLMEQPPPLSVMNVDMLWRTLLGALRRAFWDCSRKTCRRSSNAAETTPSLRGDAISSTSRCACGACMRRQRENATPLILTT